MNSANSNITSVAELSQVLGAAPNFLAFKKRSSRRIQLFTHLSQNPYAPNLDTQIIIYPLGGSPQIYYPQYTWNLQHQPGEFSEISDSVASKIPSSFQRDFHHFQQCQGAKLQKVILWQKKLFSPSLDNPLLWAQCILHTPVKNSYLIAYRDGERFFFSVTPERLYLRERNRIYTEAIAGTFHTYDTPNEKVLNEHYLVKLDIAQKLAPFLAAELQIDDLTHLPISYFSHLKQSYSGTLNGQHNDITLCKTLHPTSALLGHPSRAAWEYARERELLPLGSFYRSAIGVISPPSCEENPDTAEIAAAIRCGEHSFLKGYTHLFAGAGITAGSSLTEEHLEIQHKLNFIEQGLRSCLLPPSAHFSTISLS